MMATINRKRLDDTMSRLGYNQTEMGKALGFDQSIISKMLSGRHKIRKHHVLAFECLLRRAGKW